LAKFGQLYLWFVVIVSLLAGLPRLIVSRRFAQLQMMRMRQKSSGVRSRIMSLVVLAGGLLFGTLYFTRWGHEVWVLIAVVFSLLSAAEFFFQAQFPTEESLIFQNRLLGILYLGLAASALVMVRRA